MTKVSPQQQEFTCHHRVTGQYLFQIFPTVANGTDMHGLPDSKRVADLELHGVG